ncbi:MAG: hypothetical protein OXE95_03050 [Chloroflexi bacterium]|nr:hypothetical protein [Chloroflexota bacterium]MCY4246540.1 hypothetical protein [Chloroflexota bacterium]
MIKRMSTLLAILLISALAVVAQDVDCGDLAEADCQILIDNNALMRDLSAFHFEAEMSMDVQSAASQDTLKLGMTGSGDLAMDAAAAKDIDSMVKQLEAIIASLVGQMRFAMSIEGPGTADIIEMSMLMRDNVFLFSGSMLDELMGAPMDGMDWFGLDLTGAVADWLKQAGISDESLQDTSEQAESAATITRLDDAVLNGAPMAVFESTMALDLDALMTAGEADMGELLDSLGMELPAIAGEVTSTNYVGLDDGYTHRQEMSGAFNMGAFDMLGTTGDLQATMSLVIDLSAFAEPVAVELPEDVPAFPLAMMLTMGSQ